MNMTNYHWRGRKVLVTGATGFVGRNFVSRLLSLGADVVCPVRNAKKAESLAQAGAEIVAGDLADEAFLARSVAGREVVFHIAGSLSAYGYEDMAAVNVGLTEKIVRICASQEKPPVFLYVSSLAAMGPSRSATRPHLEGDVPAPISMYGRSKYAAETMLRKYAGRVPITVVRPPMIFGPGDQEVRKWLETIRRTGFFLIPILRPWHFSMVYVDDVSQVLLLAAEKGERLPATGASRKPGEGIYFVAQNEHPSYLEMGQLFGDAMGKKRVRTVATSWPLAYLAGFCCECFVRWTGRPPMQPNVDKVREGIAGHWTCSAEKARRQLGFEPEGTLAQQLEKTVRSLFG
ncbi:MAG: NAD-dependent epimerase/dehydratase family protein [Planctomycetia bacterium]|nr:NAD-dependent epimerase/dehydratase family protein [Planctomycetia bacterium]